MMMTLGSALADDCETMRRAGPEEAHLAGADLFFATVAFDATVALQHETDLFDAGMSMSNRASPGFDLAADNLDLRRAHRLGTDQSPIECADVVPRLVRCHLRWPYHAWRTPFGHGFLPSYAPRAFSKKLHLS
ncbi:MAG: hypothetical protein RML45_04085 [Acetobacteraceae bacterium]|nr:hypothetical protein [Acetobacteraceae bacterium]